MLINIIEERGEVLRFLLKKCANGVSNRTTLIASSISLTTCTPNVVDE